MNSEESAEANGMKINHFHIQFNVLEVNGLVFRLWKFESRNRDFFGSNFIMELKIID